MASVFIWHNFIGVPVPTIREVSVETPSQLVTSEKGNVSEKSSLPELIDVPTSNQIVVLTQEVESPMRLRITRIGVDAPIQGVGLATDGSMDVPKNPFDTGWYELGPRPGEIGSAVITGHVDSPTGASAVFTDLNNLTIGDVITIENEGAILTFRVREIRVFPAGADATKIFISTDGKAHLNLITCTGSWNAETNQYAGRLVVFADRD